MHDRPSRLDTTAGVLVYGGALLLLAGLIGGWFTALLVGGLGFICGCLLLND